MVRVYAHLEGPQTVAIEVDDPASALWGQVKRRALEACDLGEKYQQVCFYNEDQCPIADRSAVLTYLESSSHGDFWLRPLPDSAENALGDSHKKKKDLSYYYAHDRNKQLVSQVAGPARAAAPVPVRAKATPSGPVTNTRHSPFGTDVSKYESISGYSWEDANGTTVKVSISLDMVPRLTKDMVSVNFGQRQFEVLVDGERKWRFACSKTHAEMQPDACTFSVSEGSKRVTLRIRKAKDDEVWFDLFKKRAVGDDDAP